MCMCPIVHVFSAGQEYINANAMNLHGQLIMNLNLNQNNKQLEWFRRLSMCIHS